MFESIKAIIYSIFPSFHFFLDSPTPPFPSSAWQMLCAECQMLDNWLSSIPSSICQAAQSICQLAQSICQACTKHLSSKYQAPIKHLSSNCQTSVAWQMLDCCLTDACQLLDRCLSVAWQLLGTWLTDAWYLVDRCFVPLDRCLVLLERCLMACLTISCQASDTQHKASVKRLTEMVVYKILLLSDNLLNNFLHPPSGIFLNAPHWTLWIPWWNIFNPPATFYFFPTL